MNFDRQKWKRPNQSDDLEADYLQRSGLEKFRPLARADVQALDLSFEGPIVAGEPKRSQDLFGLQSEEQLLQITTPRIL
jgi:hypothetical protein